MKKNRYKKTTYVIIDGLVYLQTNLSSEELKMIIRAKKLRKIDDFE